MKIEDLAIKNNAGNTAFFLAAASGEVEIIKAMMKKNGDLTKNLGNNGILPLHKAALMGNKEIVQYLYGATQDEKLDNDNDRIELLISLVNRSLYDLSLHINFGLIVVLLDIALDLVQRHPELATARDKNEEIALHSLARRCSSTNYRRK
ncbi:uncharacterized protein LOC116127688 isoform X3 [Pistacia vera]|uniref:uncharacterized protein LOC116127688 isoform X3 n=1 Tax=Pistacia vera TaxID=55513 RepID=UPI001262DD6F|nr:uncharacterized protein LOC116127688 isoform X3 [Pistacia vera]